MQFTAEHRAINTIMHKCIAWNSSMEINEKAQAKRIDIAIATNRNESSLLCIFVYLFFFLIQMTSFMLKLILYCEFCWMTIHFLCSTSLAGVIPYSPCNLNTRFNWSLHILFLQCIFAHAWNTIFLKKNWKPVKTCSPIFNWHRKFDICTHTHTHIRTLVVRKTYSFHSAWLIELTNG